MRLANLRKIITHKSYTTKGFRYFINKKKKFKDKEVNQKTLL